MEENTLQTKYKSQKSSMKMEENTCCLKEHLI